MGRFRLTFDSVDTTRPLQCEIRHRSATHTFVHTAAAGTTHRQRTNSRLRRAKSKNGQQQCWVCFWQRFETHPTFSSPGYPKTDGS